MIFMVFSTRGLCPDVPWNWAARGPVAQPHQAAVGDGPTRGGGGGGGGRGAVRGTWRGRLGWGHRPLEQKQRWNVRTEYKVYINN